VYLKNFIKSESF